MGLGGHKKGRWKKIERTNNAVPKKKKIKTKIIDKQNINNVNILQIL